MKKLFTLLILFSFASISWSQDHTINTAPGNTFDPATLTINVGETVQFVNTGGFHNVNGTQMTYPNNPESFTNGGASSDAWTFDYTFNTAGVYNYQCDPHAGQGMLGTITVVDPFPAYPIGTVTIDSNVDGETDSVGVACTLTGVVYGIDLDGNAGISFTLIDNAGDGINIFNFADIDAYVVTEGDEITVQGEIQDYNGLAQLFVSSITVNSQSNPLLPANVVGTLDETTESQFIRLNNMTVVDTLGDFGGFNIRITDGTVASVDTFVMRVDNGTDLYNGPNPPALFNLTGIGGQFDQNAPLLDDYQIFPRYATDVQEVVIGGGPALMIIGIADPQPSNGAGSATAGAKTIQLYALQDIPDMSIYGVGVANNGGGTDGVEFTFPADAVTAGTCISFTDSINEARFLEFFGVAADYLVPSGGTSAAGLNGDDGIELFENGVVIDTYGDINVDGSGTAWDYTDGWAYRINATGPDGGTFVPGNWIYSGVDALQDNNFIMNSQFANPFPTCSYLFMVPDIEAMDDEITIIMNDPSNINVLENDITAIGVNSLMITSGPTNGTAMANGTVDITYTPTMGVCSSDSLTYEICDDNGCSQATVYISMYCNYDVALVTADNDGDFIADSTDVNVGLTGVVYGVDWDGNEGLSFTLIDSNNDGINVFNFNDVSDYAVVEGDEITVYGYITEFNGLTEIFAEEIAFNSTGNTLVTPTDITALGEETESQLVRMVNMTLVDATQWTGAGSGFNVDITDGTNTFTVRIDNEVDLYSAPAPMGVFNITGIGGQFDSDVPADGGYQLAPRYMADIEEVDATNDLELGNQIQFMPNPTSDILNVRSEIQLDEIRVYNMLGQNMVNVISPSLSETVNVNNWESGIYVLTFISGDRIYTSQFVKK